MSKKGRRVLLKSFFYEMVRWLQRNDLKNKIYNNPNFFVRIYSVMIMLTAKLAQRIYTMYIIFSSINDASNVNCLRIV